MRMVKAQLKPGFTHRQHVGGRKLVTVMPGEVVELEYSQYMAFRDRFVLKETADAEKAAAEENVQSVTNGMKIVKTGEGQYDVIQVSNGKKMNELPLTLSQAESLLG